MRKYKNEFFLTVILFLLAGCKSTSSSPFALSATDGDLSRGGGDFYEVNINSAKVVRDIPESFLGLSQEWKHVGDMVLPPVKNVMRLLSAYQTGPLNFRVGGASTDEWNYVPKEGTWRVLKELQKDLGVNFILGVNLLAGDKQLVKNQVKEAFLQLPPSSIVSFEIGNEPNYFEPMGQKPKGWLNRYPGEFSALAQFIRADKSCVLCQKPIFAGPVWGHIFLAEEKLKWFLGTYGKHLNLVTIHYYQAQKEERDTPQSLLADGRMQKAMGFLAMQVKESAKHGLKVRIAESNTLSNGGLLGVSDSFSSALWVLDTSFEIIKNGGVGVNYHQGSGAYGFYAKTGQGPNDVVIKPSVFGLIMFQKAVSGPGAQLVASDYARGNGDVKIWPVSQGGELRVVMLNKNGERPAKVKLSFDRKVAAKAYVAKLAAPTPALFAQKGIKLSDVDYAAGQGVARTDEKLDSVIGKVEKDKVSYDIELIPGSASMLIVKRE